MARSAVTMVCALALTAGVSATSAQAKVDVTGFVAKPIAANASCSTTTSAATESQAGANKDFCVAMAFNGGGDGFGGGDDVRDLRMSLPPGQIGGATATPTCSAQRFQSTSGCPASSQVGEASGRIEAVLTLPENIITGKIFNLTPRTTEAARLGVQLELAGLAAVQKVEAVVLLRGDGGLDAVSVGLPRTFIGLPIEIRRFNLKLWGSNTDHPSMAKPFVVNPTDCSKPATSRVIVDSAQGVRASASSTYQPTGCDKLQFTPQFVMEGERKADSPGELTMGMTFPASTSNGLAPARVKTADLLLPQGYELSASSGSEPDFVACTDEQFAVSEATRPSCPKGSQVGTVRFRSPLLAEQLTGIVYVAAQRPGVEPIRIFIFAETGQDPDSSRVKLTADIVPDPQTGQLTGKLRNLPPVPFTEFYLTFRGGDTALAATPRSCGTRTGSATVVPDSGGPAKTPTAEITVDQACGDPSRFEPQLTTSLLNTQAGAATVITANIIRPDANARLASAKLSLPAGFAGRLTAADQCPVDVAQAGGCGEGSRVGIVGTRVGPGPRPAPVNGKVFLTAPQAPGDLAGLGLVVPAQFGPLNFGNLVALARIVVRPDIGLDILVGDIPRRVYGVDVNLRQMTLTLDREGFGLNATSCAPMQATGTLTSDMGTTAEVSAPYQATGCENVPYAPTLAASLVGGRAAISKDGHPELRASVGSGVGNGGTKSLDLVLPEGISIDVTRIKRSCPLADYKAGTCRPESVVGSAIAVSPLVNEPAVGNVTFVMVPGAPLPELRVDLHGPLSISLAGQVSQQGKHLVTTVSGLPDTPLTKFDMTLAGGDRGLLQTSRDLCATPTLPFDAKFSSFTGATSTRSISADLPDCTPGGTVKLGALRSGKPALDVRVVGGRTAVTTASLTLPKGLTFGRSASVKKLARISASGLKKGAKATITVSGSTLRVTAPKGQSATVLRVRLRAGGVRVSQRLRRAGRPKLNFRLSTSLTDGRRPSLRLSARPAASPQS
ncbi:MAG: hypothetical protein JHC95_15005 [Solirubrobacteraceae bacterium]|nr:hypothetical protein [Solirubrobacteraceae bacterium]